MLGKVLALSSLISFVLLSALMQVTSPSTVHPVVILFIFVLIYVLALGSLTFLLLAAQHLLRRKKTSTFTTTQAYYLASVLALMPVMMLGVQSIGRADIYSSILIILFELVACFYVVKRLKM